MTTPTTVTDVLNRLVAEHDLKEGELVVFGEASNGDDLRQPIYWCPNCGSLFSACLDNDTLWMDRRCYNEYDSSRCHCRNAEGEFRPGDDKGSET